jgi:hypothetical protein
MIEAALPNTVGIDDCRKLREDVNRKSRAAAPAPAAPNRRHHYHHDHAAHRAAPPPLQHQQQQQQQQQQQEQHQHQHQHQHQQPQQQEDEEQHKIANLIDYNLALNEHINQLHQEQEQHNWRVKAALSATIVIGGLLSLGGVLVGSRRSK